MYLAHFNLSVRPFRAPRHADFFFAGAHRGEILAALRAAILSGKGLMSVTGEAGSGKTMLCQVLAAQLPTGIKTIYLAGSTLVSDNLLQVIADNFGASLEKIRPAARIRCLQKLLIERNKAGKSVVIMVDDAHAIPDHTLEEIRLLSSLDQHHCALLHIILFGQPLLYDRLLNPRLHLLRERIAFRFELGPLNTSDTAAYIDWQMRAADLTGTPCFSQQALRLISQASGGNPRRINRLADKSLQFACSEGSREILTRHTRSAIASSDLRLPRQCCNLREDWHSSAAFF